MKKVINSPLAPAPIGAYNQAVEVGNMLFVSGQIPYCQQTETMVLTNIEDQTKQVMQNLQYILQEAGYTFANVVKATIFIKDMNQFATINSIYGTYFDQENAPARECVEVARLPKDVEVEISVIAAK